MIKSKKYTNIIYLLFFFLFIFLAIKFVSGLNLKTNGFSNYGLGNPGLIPKSEKLPLLTDFYKYSGNKNVSNNNYSNIWWYFPIFREGSYKQITNNLRYYKNPDEGTCITADFCGALYKDKKIKSNYIYPLPPVTPEKGARVNYYYSKLDLLL